MSAQGGQPVSRWGPVLVGMRGSGKSSVAPRVAARLGMRAIDADAELEQRAGRSIAELFAQGGEQSFRELERGLLLDDLLQRTEVVLATGGGAVLHGAVRDVLRQRVTVWLSAPVQTLACRIAGSARPSLTGQPIEHELSQVLAARAALYREVASLVLDTGEAELEHVVAAVCEHWLQRGAERDGGASTPRR